MKKGQSQKTTNKKKANKKAKTNYKADDETQVKCLKPEDEEEKKDDSEESKKEDKLIVTEKKDAQSQKLCQKQMEEGEGEKIRKNMPTTSNNEQRDEIQDKAEKQEQGDDANDNDNDNANDDEDDEGIMTNSSFASLGVCEPLCEAISKLDWKNASRIQKEVLPHAIEGKDIIGLAETGSGKTGSFCIPILQELLQNPVRGSIFAVMLAPTRELAFQIQQVVEALGVGIGATSVCIVGGVDMTTQAIALARNPHIVVATPGRLVDHLAHTKGFSLRKLKYLVMDEADRMLSLDFEQELNEILDVIPDSTQGRRTMLFSATMTSKVQKLQRASLSDPVRIEVSTKFQTPKKLLQSYLFIPAKYKDCYLAYLMNEHAGQSILVFGATCNNVQRLALMLRNLGFPAICLHGQMTQPKRLGALHKFKSGGKDILICTDVAARGLDIPSVDVVINFDLPGHGKDYIHRVGRTARAGRSGKAIAMVTQYDVEVYQRLEGLLGTKLPEYKLNEETVLILLERVSEAQRMATRELKEQLATAGGGRNGRRRKKRSSFDDDDEGTETMERLVEKELKKGYYGGGSGGHGGALPNQRGSKSKQKKPKRR